MNKPPPDHVVLTDRQATILRLHQAGMSQRDIALHLNITRATVRDHLTAAHHRQTKKETK